jgi:hypothetical protein
MKMKKNEYVAPVAAAARVQLEEMIAAPMSAESNQFKATTANSNVAWGNESTMNGSEDVWLTWE